MVETPCHVNRTESPERERRGKRPSPSHRPDYPPDPLRTSISRVSRARRPPQRLLALARVATDDERTAAARGPRRRAQHADRASTSRAATGRAASSIDDLEQVAYLGLVKAVPAVSTPSAPPTSSATPCPTIRGEVRRYFRDHGWAVRPPRTVQQAQARITAVESDLCQELGRAPRPSEIAERLDLDLDLVVEALAANGCFAPTSLDSTPTEGESAHRRPARR